MANIGFDSLAHAFASVFHDIMTGAKAAVRWEQKSVQPHETQIEMLSALIPGYGPEVVLLERLAFASFGFLAATLHTNGYDVSKTATVTGASESLLTTLSSFLQANPALVKQATSLL